MLIFICSGVADTDTHAGVIVIPDTTGTDITTHNATTNKPNTVSITAPTTDGRDRPQQSIINQLTSPIKLHHDPDFHLT